MTDYLELGKLVIGEVENAGVRPPQVLGMHNDQQQHCPGSRRHLQRKQSKCRRLMTMTLTMMRLMMMRWMIDDVDYDLLKKYLASADGDLMGARIVMFPPRWFQEGGNFLLI